MRWIIFTETNTSMPVAAYANYIHANQEMINDNYGIPVEKTNTLAVQLTMQIRVREVLKMVLTFSYA